MAALTPRERITAHRKMCRHMQPVVTVREMQEVYRRVGDYNLSALAGLMTPAQVTEEVGELYRFMGLWERHLFAQGAEDFARLLLSLSPTFREDVNERVLRASQIMGFQASTGHRVSGIVYSIMGLSDGTVIPSIHPYASRFLMSPVACVKRDTISRTWPEKALREFLLYMRHLDDLSMAEEDVLGVSR